MNTRAASASSLAASSPPRRPMERSTTTVASSNLGGISGLVQEVDNATAKWMKMISSTFLGEHAHSVSSTLFARQPDALPAPPLLEKNQVEHVPTFKIALVGGSGVGKTSIVRRWAKKSYPSKYTPTIGVDVTTIPYVHLGQDVVLQVWDVASVEVDAAQTSLHALICEDLDGIFFVFNVHRVSSVAAIDKWRHQLAKFISAKEIPFFLISHKADLLQKRIMASDDIESYAQAAGYKGWMWTVGRASFGENEKNPAVMQALARMVALVHSSKRGQIRGSQRSFSTRGILETSSHAVPLEIVHTDDSLQEFSASLLRIPTMAITTLPREEEASASKKDAHHEINKKAPRAQTKQDYGGNWLLGNDKGMYLRVTNDSVLAREETDDEKEGKDTEDEAHEFPFAKTKLPAEVGESDDDHDAESALDTSTADPNEIDDTDAWRFFAGSINRTRSEQILQGRELGTFLLRRKDSRTLILSYVGATQVHHALIEFTNRRYHVGSSKSSQVSFSSLTKCLRSVRKYAFRGLVFTRNVELRPGNSEDLTIESDEETRDEVNFRTFSTSGVWRARSGSGSSSGTSQRSPGKPTRQPGLQASQVHVKMPPKAKIEELSVKFYEQLETRLSHLPPEQSAPLLEMASNEKKERKRSRSADPEAQWRQLVKSMEAWNRIVMNLELTFLKATSPIA